MGRITGAFLEDYIGVMKQDPEQNPDLSARCEVW